MRTLRQLREPLVQVLIWEQVQPVEQLQVPQMMML